MPFDGSSYNTIASRILNLLGENGENWYGHGWGRHGQMCLLHAAYDLIAYKNNHFTPWENVSKAVEPLVQVIGRRCPDYGNITVVSLFNDSHKWPAVKKMLKKAHEIELQGVTNAV